MIPIVNEHDEIIGHKDRADRLPTDIIRVTAVWITNEKGEILLAQRAFNKKYHPGLWGPAVAGTVEEGETYESNAVKEAEEEIGLVGVPLTARHKVRKIDYRLKDSPPDGDFFGQWFSAVIDSGYPLVKQDSEVERLAWFTPEKILANVAAHPESFVPIFVSEAVQAFIQK